MKRLIRKSNKQIKRLIKKAEWTPIDPSNEDVVQVITNFMAIGGQIQIEYEGSGWRLIQPYGWNTSKDGNILLMCYKDTGEIRSYRLDRVNQVLIDDAYVENQPLTVNDMYEIEDYNSDPSDFEIPELPNMEQIIEETENEMGQESPFDEGINYLNNDFNENNEFNEVENFESDNLYDNNIEEDSNQNINDEIEEEN